VAKQPDPDSTDAAAVVDRLAASLSGNAGPAFIDLGQVPAIETETQKAYYQSAAARLYEGLPGPPEERARSARGQLAAALWQRVAEWEERDEERLEN